MFLRITAPKQLALLMVEDAISAGVEPLSVNPILGSHETIYFIDLRSNTPKLALLREHLASMEYYDPLTVSFKTASKRLGLGPDVLGARAHISGTSQV